VARVRPCASTEGRRSLLRAICAVNMTDQTLHGLFIKLMKRNIPITLLMLLEHWFAIEVTCVKWGSIMSRFIGPVCGIRQGDVLSPYFSQFLLTVLLKKLLRVISVAI